MTTGSTSSCLGNYVWSSLVVRITWGINYFSAQSYLKPRKSPISTRDQFADLARAIAEQSPVAELRYKNTVFGGKYCGMGRMGDNVCVFAGNDIVRAWSDNTRSFFKKNIVMIEQGAIASGGIKLNWYTKLFGGRTEWAHTLNHVNNFASRLTVSVYVSLRDC